MKLEKELSIHMYKTMKTIREFEEKIMYLYAKGYIPSIIHLYIGEEAVAAGVCAALSKDDYITSTHRGHGHVIAKGAELKPMMAELFGKRTGYCKGKGASMHIADIEGGVLGANGIAGGGLPIATGAAWSAKWRKTKQVAVCFFGDDSSNNGTFHESLNLASIHKLPVIFVCENNLYGISVCQAKHMPIKDIAIRATAYDMPGVIVDGNDVIDVYRAASQAAERAREGEGPTLIECKTYRWRGHHEGDPDLGIRYRTKEEIEEWKEKCPIKRLTTQLIDNGHITEKQLQEIDDQILSDIQDAIAFAEQSEFPQASELYEDIYVNN